MQHDEEDDAGKSPINDKGYEQGDDELVVKKERPVLLFTIDQIASTLKKREVEWHRIAYQILFFFVGIAILCLSCVSYTDYGYYITGYTYITNNWRNDYYTDISLSYSDLLCNQEFDESYLEMNTYGWPGTQNGCDCSNHVKKNLTKQMSNSSTSDEIDENAGAPADLLKRMFVGVTCNRENQKQRCETVNEQIPKPLQLWSDGQFGQPIRLCGKTQANVNFANSAPMNDTCGIGQIPCGSGDLLFCVSQNSSCPVNYVGFQTNKTLGNGVWKAELSSDVLAQYDKIQDLIDKGNISQLAKTGGILTINDKFRFFYFKNWTGYAPLSEIKVSESFNQSSNAETVNTGGVCFFSNISNLDATSQDYPLMKMYRQNCVTDPRFKLFHVINEVQYYLCNNFAFVEQILPNYDISPDKTWGIHFRGYIEWKAVCRGSQFKDAIKYGDGLIDIQTTQYALILITIFYFIIVSIVFTSVSCCAACGIQLPCIDGIIFNLTQIAKAQKQSNDIFLAQSIFTIIWQFVIIGIVAWAYTISKNTKKFLDGAISQNCSDVHTIVPNYFQYKQQFFQSLSDFIQTYICLFIITLAINFLVIALVHKSNQTKLDTERELIFIPDEKELVSPSHKYKYQSQNFQFEADHEKQKVLKMEEKIEEENEELNAKKGVDKEGSEKQSSKKVVFTPQKSISKEDEKLKSKDNLIDGEEKTPKSQKKNSGSLKAKNIKQEEYEIEKSKLREKYSIVDAKWTEYQEEKAQMKKKLKIAKKIN